MVIKKKKLIIFISVATIIVALAVLLFAILQKDKMTGEDFSELTWAQAFVKLNETMSHQYAFTELKDIRWQSLYNKYLPQIEAAQSEDSFNDYYIALRAYINEIPDGHVKMNSIADIDGKFIGGSFGFTAAQLDDGKVIVTWLDPFGPAYAAGLQVGAEITLWNGQPVAEKAAAVSTIFAPNSATYENLKQKQFAYLVRAPLGTELTIMLTDSRSFSLIAYDDQLLSLKKNYPSSVVSVKLWDMLYGNENPDPEPEGVAEKKILDGNILYIKLWALVDLDLRQTGNPVSTLKLMREAVAYANEKRCDGIILDLRNNAGGLDEMVAEILGLFYSEKTLYEYQKYGASDDLLALYITPEEQRFEGKIIALTNSQCISSGEGVALGVKNLPNGETLGFYGTNGSFGMSGGQVKMPEGITIDYPFGQSLDKDKHIQLDSRNGVGGVSPSIRIPMTEKNALRIANGEDVELEEAQRILTK
jgi:carboxyl-terminal processing protease